MSSETPHNDDKHHSGKTPKHHSEDFPLQEYRLVPVEEWEEHQEDDDEIDLVELSRHIWDQRMFIAKVTGIFVIIGLLVFLLSPVEYETQATLLPEVQSSQGMAGSLLKQYGGLLGISGNNLSMGQDNMIPPTLYPQIVQSLPFQLELLNQKVTFSEFDTTATVYGFFDEIYTPSVFSYVLRYTIGLPGKIKRLFTEETLPQPLPKGFESDSVISVTKDQMKIIEDMQDRIMVSLDEESGVLTLTAEMPDPEAAAEVGQKGIALLKEYVTNYRTRKGMVDLDFARTQMGNAKQRFEEAQNHLADFRDSNMNLATAKAQTQEQRLQSEYELAFNVYNSLAQQVEQAKLKVQEQTPVVSVLQPISVPIEKSWPRSKLILLTSILLGIVFSIGKIIFNHIIS